MMKFQNFEVLYGAACEIVAVAGDNQIVAKAVRNQKRVLLSQFSANFPSSLEDAFAHPGFEIQQFLNMLLKFPETLKGKAEKLSALIKDFEENCIPVPDELKQICENLQEKPKVRSSEEDAIGKALNNTFPRTKEKLDQMPFTQEAVLAYMAAYPETMDGKRSQFISLMDDLCRHKVELPDELKRQWRGMVMQP